MHHFTNNPHDHTSRPQDLPNAHDEDFVYDSSDSDVNELLFPSDGSDCEDVDSTLDLKSKLAFWAVGRIPHTYVNELLAILKEHPCHSDLPGDCRTLLKTPRKLKVFPGKYVHFGIVDRLIQVLEKFFFSISRPYENFDQFTH